MSKCSDPSCNKIFNVIVDGIYYCNIHNNTDLGLCNILRAVDGLPCKCKSRRSVNGVATCLRHIPKSENVECCSICLDDCKIGTKSTICGHVFHPVCLNIWKFSYCHDNCPMCRTVLCKPKKKVKVEININLIERLQELVRNSSDSEDFSNNVFSLIAVEDLSEVLSFIRTYNN